MGSDINRQHGDLDIRLMCILEHHYHFLLIITTKRKPEIDILTALSVSTISSSSGEHIDNLHNVGSLPRTKAVRKNDSSEPTPLLLIDRQLPH